MREKYESLSLGALKEIARARGMKGLSSLKKSELVERMLQEDEKDKKLAEKKEAKAEGKKEEHRKEEHRREEHKKETRDLVWKLPSQLLEEHGDFLFAKTYNMW